MNQVDNIILFGVMDELVRITKPKINKDHELNGLLKLYDLIKSDSFKFERRDYIRWFNYLADAVTTEETTFDRLTLFEVIDAYLKSHGGSPEIHSLLRVDTGVDYEIFTKSGIDYIQFPLMFINVTSITHDEYLKTLRVYIDGIISDHIQLRPELYESPGNHLLDVSEGFTRTVDVLEFGEINTRTYDDNVFTSETPTSKDYDQLNQLIKLERKLGKYTFKVNYVKALLHTYNHIKTV